VFGGGIGKVGAYRKILPRIFIVEFVMSKIKQMDIDKIFPCILIVLSLGASFFCFWKGDIRRGVYWFAAAVLNTTVTF